MEEINHNINIKGCGWVIGAKSKIITDVLIRFLSNIKRN